MPKKNVQAWIIIFVGVFLVIGFGKSGDGFPLGWVGLALIILGIFMRIKASTNRQ